MVKPEQATQQQFDDYMTRAKTLLNYTIGVTSAALKDYPRAVDGFKTALVTNPGDALIRYQMGVNMLQLTPPAHMDGFWSLARAINLKVAGEAQVRSYLKNQIVRYQGGLIQCEKETDAQVAELLALAGTLEGLTRNVGMHAGGVLIAPGKLTDFCPLYVADASDAAVSQFDKDDVESIGLVKFDFLGLTTLTILDWTLRHIRQLDTAADLRLEKLPLDDRAAYAVFQQANTTAVFQFESRGMRDLLKNARPDRFGDLIALVALYRPGPMELIPDFCARKHGRRFGYPDPRVESILAETYGIMVYQEQVMQMAQIIGGYSLGGADLLRRAMGKKIQAEMDAQRDTFVKGCAEHNGIAVAKANELFDLIDKFAGYGFNKSHAAAYALLAYQTAWLKAHYPHEFFAASMSFDAHQTDKLAVFVDDMRRLGVAIEPPSINASEADFSVEGTGEGLAVRYALGALKGVGEKAMASLTAEREANGEFDSLDDFASRIDPKLLNKRQVEALIGAGAFDAIESDRAALYAGAEQLLAAASNAAHERASGQGGLFGGGDVATVTMQLPKAEPWTQAERMGKERDAFGYYFAAHPVQQYDAILTARGAQSYADICAREDFTPGTRGPMVLAG